MKPVIIKTYVHLTDAKGWEKTLEYPGDFQCGRFFRIPKYPRLLPMLPPNPPQDLKRTDYDFELTKETMQGIYDNYFFKNLFFTEDY